MIVETDLLQQRFKEIRKWSERICQPLQTEDFVVQPIDFVSPPKWHLAHTTWFFEEFVLKNSREDYQVFDEQFSFLFNSYYESVGEHWIRDRKSTRLNSSHVAISYA